ncbi:MAG TPA: hypothetical protein VFS51_03355 [Gemmatimonadales bacterium]|nr:hypothetical protein [Gemmatimonadales bacterium]
MKWGFVGTAALVVVLSACQEKLTAPVDCPALCPGGQPVVFDEVFNPVVGADSSFRGYVQPHAADALLAANGFQGFEELALVRFLRRADSVSVRDTLRAYVIDSVALSFTILARDTTLTGLQVELYRLSPVFDSTISYAGIVPAFVFDSLVATINVPDTVKSGTIRQVFQGPDLSRVQIAPADSGRLGLGLRVVSPPLTGVRFGALGSGTGANFTTYVTADIPDTGTAKIRTINAGVAFNTYVSQQQTQMDDPTRLAVGGEPSARAFLHFDLPSRIRDSATIVRATLELTPVDAISGLPTDPARLFARALLANAGPKSPVNTAPARVPIDTLDNGATTVSLEIVRLVELWLGATPRPSALSLALDPDLEAASFTRPMFHSTLAADPSLRPRLRVSYLRSFPFENP